VLLWLRGKMKISERHKRERGVVSESGGRRIVVLRSCCLLWRTQPGESARTQGAAEGLFRALALKTSSSPRSFTLCFPCLTKPPTTNQHVSCNKEHFTSNRFIRRTLASHLILMGIAILCLLVCLHQFPRSKDRVQSLAMTLSAEQSCSPSRSFSVVVVALTGSGSYGQLCMPLVVFVLPACPCSSLSHSRRDVSRARIEVWI
jgi:hypothetical protein